MARRSKSSQNPTWIISIIVIALIAFGGAAFLFQHTAEPFRTTETLNVSTYLENARSIRGNTYRLEGTVDNSLALSPTQGRLISVSVSSENDSILPIIVPNDFNHINIQKGQQFVFLIEVDDQGILKTLDLSKS
ncbi:MAG: hypothetical protein ACK5LK_05530 [Chthoniobacterales bacterium]